MGASCGSLVRSGFSLWAGVFAASLWGLAIFWGHGRGRHSLEIPAPWGGGSCPSGSLLLGGVLKELKSITQPQDIGIGFRSQPQPQPQPMLPSYQSSSSQSFNESA